MRRILAFEAILVCLLVTGCASSHVRTHSHGQAAADVPADTSEVVAAGQYISVSGEVSGPGNVAYREDLTVVGAINTRGGFTEHANREAVRLIREDKVMSIDCIKAIDNPGQDPDVFPGDKIVVPRKKP